MIELIIGFVTVVCLAFVSICIALRWSNLFLCGLTGVAVYIAIPVIYWASLIELHLNGIITIGAYAAALSFFTVIIPVLALDYGRFKRSE